MGLLTKEERRRLIELLLDLPNIHNLAARHLLEVNLPHKLQREIPTDNAPAIHIANIVDAVNDDVWAQLPDGSWPVLTVIEDAIERVEGSRLASELRMLQRILEPRAEQRGLLLQPAAQAINERIIRKRLPFLDLQSWNESLMRAAQAVCRIETPTAMGTGFLVGPNLVFTCQHVVADVIASPSERGDVVLRFDYTKSADGTTLNDGKEHRLATTADWLIDSNLQLDYALMMTQGTPGTDPVAGRADNPSREWLHPSSAHILQQDDALFIIQHPKASPLKLAFDTEAILGFNSDSTRVKYCTNTEPGSSGSPCFTINWELVAMHCKGDVSAPPGFNEGVLLGIVCTRPKVAAALHL